MKRHISRLANLLDVQQLIVTELFAQSGSKEVVAGDHFVSSRNWVPCPNFIVQVYTFRVAQEKEG